MENLLTIPEQQFLIYHVEVSNHKGKIRALCITEGADTILRSGDAGKIFIGMIEKTALCELKKHRILEEGETVRLQVTVTINDAVLTVLDSVGDQIAIG